MQPLSSPVGNLVGMSNEESRDRERERRTNIANLFISLLLTAYLNVCLLHLYQSAFTFVSIFITTKNCEEILPNWPAKILARNKLLLLVQLFASVSVCVFALRGAFKALKLDYKEKSVLQLSYSS